MVERALEHIRGLDEPEVLDVGTGTGAIALAIADEVPDARVTAIDSSPDALALARENLDLTGINGRVRLVEQDLTSGLGEAQFDLVVSNPPYVEPERVGDAAARGARLGAARRARRQGCDRGCGPRRDRGAAARRLARARDALRPAGERVERLLAELGYEQVTITPDLAGRDRVVEGRWRG